MEKTIREVKSLESLNELNLSFKTKAFLLKNYRTVEEIVWEGRRLAYLSSEGQSKTGEKQAPFEELILALDSAGFIRHDITPGSFCINSLYQEIFPEADLKLATKMDKLNNEDYENFRIPNFFLIYLMKGLLEVKLGDRDGGVVEYYFGFSDGSNHSTKETAAHFGLEYDTTRNILLSAKHKLRYENPLPLIFEELKPA